MKNILISLLILMSTIAIYAQEERVDIIIKIDGTKIDAQVTEVEVDRVKYKLISNLSGPIYSLKKGDIASILYSNGTSEVFTNELLQNNSNTPVQNYISKPTYANEISGLALRDYQSELKGARTLAIIGDVFFATGCAMAFSGLMVGLIVDDFLGFAILMPAGGTFIIPGVVMAVVGNHRIRNINRDMENQVSLYEFKLGKNLKQPINLAIHSNGLSIKF